MKYTVPPQKSKSKFINTILFFVNSFYNVLTSKKLKNNAFRLTTYLSQTSINQDTEDAAASPSRKICNIFWNDLNWKCFKESLGHINLVDFGCGTGIYYDKLKVYSTNLIDNYLGIDMKSTDKWENVSKNNSNAKFETYNGYNILEKIPSGTNMLISQSVLEHVENDLEILSQIKTFTDNIKSPFIQIHLVPALSGIYVFGKHGYRQYSPRTLEMIYELFENSKVEIFELGSIRSNILHFLFITLPNHLFIGDLREYKAFKYKNRSEIAVKKDLTHPLKFFSPAFYAITIKSNFTGESPNILK